MFFLGQSASAEDARSLIARYRARNLDTVLSEVGRYWEDVLGAVQVKTPDRPMDIMLNGWLLYQTLACRIWARSAFYQLLAPMASRSASGWHAPPPPDRTLLAALAARSRRQSSKASSSLGLRSLAVRAPADLRPPRVVWPTPLPYIDSTATSPSWIRWFPS